MLTNSIAGKELFGSLPEGWTNPSEMTGIQALERAAPTLPMEPGKPDRREFEYIRHGTQTLIASFDVNTDKVLTPAVGDTRTEEDFVEHVSRIVETARKGSGALSWTS
jgi:hypothetical protein